MSAQGGFGNLCAKSAFKKKKIIITSAVRYEAHEESKLITERKGRQLTQSRASRKCWRRSRTRHKRGRVTIQFKQNEAVESRRGFAMKIEEQSRSMVS